MKICIIDPGSYVLPYVCFFAEGLILNGHCVVLYCSYTEYNYELIEQLKIKYPNNFNVKSYKISRTVSINLFHSLVGYIKLTLQCIINRSRYDLFVVQFGIFLPLDIIFFCLIRRQLYLVLHDDVPHGFRRKYHIPTFIRAILSNKILFPSAAIKSRFFHRYPFKFISDRSFLLQHGLLSAKISPSQEYNSTVERDDLRLTFFGTIKPYKGVDSLYSLFKNKNINQLDIYGKWDPDLIQLRENCVNIGINIYDRYLDADTIDQIMNDSRVFILPYNSATQSGVLYLLLNYTCPFVCTDTGDLGSFLRRAGLAKLICNNNKPESLLPAIDYALNNYCSIRQILFDLKSQYRWDLIIKKSMLFN